LSPKSRLLIVVSIVTQGLRIVVPMVVHRAWLVAAVVVAHVDPRDVVVVGRAVEVVAMVVRGVGVVGGGVVAVVGGRQREDRR